MNDKKVPQLFVADTDSANADPAHFPWTMGFQASKRTEASAYAKYILQNKPSAKIAVLYSQDPSGEEWLGGLREGHCLVAIDLDVRVQPSIERVGACKTGLDDLARRRRAGRESS